MGSRSLEPVNSCFDSNIIIDALNGVDDARKTLREADQRFVSVVTWIEVLAGCRGADEEARAGRLLEAMSVVELAGEVAVAAVGIRREGRLKLPDAVVLATARVLGCPLLTRNTKDFPADDPEIRVPYRL